MTHELRVFTHDDADVRWWFDVKIHDTADELRAAAREWERRHGNLGVDFDDCAGCFHQSYGPTRYLGTMRLCRDHLTIEIVTHESVHAAATFTRRVRESEIRLPRSVGAAEEHLAYAAGSFTAFLLPHLGFAP